MLTNFIYAKSKAMFEERLDMPNEVPDEAIVFIEDTKEIWNHGHYFAGEGVDVTDFNNLQTQVAEMSANKLDRTEYAIPDWNNSDNVVGYIKNRTHYFEVSEESQSANLGAYNTNSVLPFTDLYEDCIYKITHVTNGHNTLFKFKTGSVIELPVNGPELQARCELDSNDNGVLRLLTSYNIDNPIYLQGGYLKPLDDVYFPDTIARESNLKTINGQSILGEGDLTIGWTEEEFGDDEIITPNPNVFYYNYNPVSHLRVREMTLPYPAPHRVLSKIVFKTADSCSLTLPTEVYWANGVIPEILPNTIYELSIEYSLGFYKAILLPFNQI